MNDILYPNGDNLLNQFIQFNVVVGQFLPYFFQHPFGGVLQVVADNGMDEAGHVKRFEPAPCFHFVLGGECGGHNTLPL